MLKGKLLMTSYQTFKLLNPEGKCTLLVQSKRRNANQTLGRRRPKTDTNEALILEVLETNLAKLCDLIRITSVIVKKTAFHRCTTLNFTRQAFFFFRVRCGNRIRSISSEVEDFRISDSLTGIYFSSKQDFEEK